MATSDKTALLDLAQTLTNKTLTSPVLTSPVINTGVSGTAVKDEDTMSSNSATHLATQQSIKAYVDSGTVTMTNKTLASPVINTQISGTAFLDEDDFSSDSDVRVASQQSIGKYVRDAAITLTNKTLASPTITSGGQSGTLPTEGMGAAFKIMTGDSDTITWFYLNTAPPGWKVLATGADSVLAVAGGSGEYNVNGGNPDTVHDWTTNWNHQLTVDEIPSHSHTVYFDDNEGTAGSDIAEPSNAPGGELSSGATGGGGTHNHGRPSASIGKLFQLDTA